MWLCFLLCGVPFHLFFDDVLNSDIWVKKIAASSYYDKVLTPIELTIGNTYSFGGYEWIVAEKPSSDYVVLQSKGITHGVWSGYKMSGTLTNASGNTITLTAENSYYTGNIDGYDISNYDSTTQSLYSSIKAAEYTSATYGKGLYLVSNAKAGTTIRGNQGSGHYWEALKYAATNTELFGGGYKRAWLGIANGAAFAWHVASDGTVEIDYQIYNYTFAPAFNLNTRLIKLSGNSIELLIK